MNRSKRPQLHKVRAPICQFAWLALGISCGLCLSQTLDGAHSAAGEGAVHLEPRTGRTTFRIGEPVILDLVFASRSPGYVVKTDDNPYSPASDQVDIAPDGGWVRTHVTFRGQALNGNAITTLAADPIRVPVLLNRTITFLKPGHYGVTVTTERLLKAENMMVATSLESCEPCRVTNAVGIDISEADDSQESALVLSLARELEATAKPTDNKISPEQKAVMDHLRAGTPTEYRLNGGRPQKARSSASTDGRIGRESRVCRPEALDARREAAVRLACLDGDDAVRGRCISSPPSPRRITAIPTSGLPGSWWTASPVRVTSKCNSPWSKMHGATQNCFRPTPCRQLFVKPENSRKRIGSPTSRLCGRVRLSSARPRCRNTNVRSTRSSPLCRCAANRTEQKQ